MQLRRGLALRHRSIRNALLFSVVPLRVALSVANDLCVRAWKLLLGEKVNLFGQTDAQSNKKTDATASRDSGFNCVGLLVNGSPGFWPDYPLFSHPKDFDNLLGADLFKAPQLNTIIGAPIGKYKCLPRKIDYSSRGNLSTCTPQGGSRSSRCGCGKT